MRRSILDTSRNLKGTSNEKYRWPTTATSFYPSTSLSDPQSWRLPEKGNLSNRVTDQNSLMSNSNHIKIRATPRVSELDKCALCNKSPAMLFGKLKMCIRCSNEMNRSLYKYWCMRVCVFIPCHLSKINILVLSYIPSGIDNSMPNPPLIRRSRALPPPLFMPFHPEPAHPHYQYSAQLRTESVLPRKSYCQSGAGFSSRQLLDIK
jgi:hypothetical protein